jgi:hypothetical protein
MRQIWLSPRIFVSPLNFDAVWRKIRSTAFNSDNLAKNGFHRIGITELSSMLVSQSDHLPLLREACEQISKDRQHMSS